MHVGVAIVTNQIISDEFKFRHVAMNLETSIILFIMDLLRNLPETNKY